MRRFPPRGLASFAVALAITAAAMAQAPAPSPARQVTPGGSIPLTSYVPKDNLLTYVEFQGVEAHAASWSKTSASKILNDTTTGAMLDDLVSQFFASSTAKAAPGQNPRPAGAELAAILKHVGKNGVVLAMQNNPAAPNGLGKIQVFRGALRPDSKTIFASLIKSLTPVGGKSQIVDKPGGRKAIVVTRADGGVEVVWWVEKKEDLVLTNDPDGVIACLDGKTPNVTENPTRTELFKGEEGFEPIGVAWFDVDAFPAGPSQAAVFFGKLDINGVNRIDYRVGFRGESLMDDFRLLAPAPRTGNLALFDQPKFDLKTLPPLPEGVSEFAAISFDPARVYGQLTTFAKTLNPQAESSIQAAEAAVKAKTRMRLREDILGRLGPKMIAYASPVKAARPGGFFSGLGTGGLQVPKGALLVEIKDAKTVTKLLDELALAANKEIKARMPKPPAESKSSSGSGSTSTKKAGSTAPANPEFKVTLNNPKTYVLNLPTQYAAMTNVRLTVAVGKKYLVIASMPDAAKEALAAEAKPSGKGLASDAAKAVEGLPAGLMFLSVSDPRSTLPEAIIKLPTTLNTALNMSPASLGLPLPGGAMAGPGSVAIKVDPARLPKPEAIRALLTPGSSALSVDDQFIRLTSRYAFPDFPTMLDRLTQAQAYAALRGVGATSGTPAAGTPTRSEGTQGAPRRERELPMPR